MKRLMMVVAIVAGAASLAQAKTCVWTGAAGTGDYLYMNNADNWQDGQLPTKGDTVVMSTTSSSVIVPTENYTFENFYFTNTCGGTLSANSGACIGVSGTDSKVVNVSNEKPLVFYTPFRVEEGARLEFIMPGAGITLNGNDRFRGTGEFVVSGSGTVTGSNFNIGSNPNFHGTWNFYRPVWIGGGIKDPFGGDDVTVNVYGQNSEANQTATLAFGGDNTVSGEINFFHKTTLSVSASTDARDSIVTFNGNVTYTALSSSYRQFDISAGIKGRGWTSGFVFKKDCVCASGNKAYMNIYSYSGGTYLFDVRGKFTPTVSDTNPPAFGSFHDDLVFEVYIGGPMTAGHSWKLVPRSYNHYYTTAANVLPNGTVRIDWGSRFSGTPGAFLDLQGYDQKITSFQYDNDKDQAFTVQSTRPATLKVSNNETATHVMPLLKGSVSVYGYAISANNGSHTFSKTYETTGWIGTEKNTIVLAETAKLPNIGGIECTGPASVIIRAGAELNSDMTLDVHDITGNKVRIATGKNVDVKHVFADGVDLPAGVYCRTGAGVEGATEVAWLNKVASDTDEMKGTVTVAEHDPVWIWTGKGSTSSFTDAANWGANAAPDLTNAKLTLNLKNAAGNADMVVPLNGTIAPAGVFNCGDYSKDGGAVTFGGDGTLVLGDAGAAATNDLKMAFTEAASFTWNGAGTLYLTGKSTSTGALTVNSGKVILDYAGWTGKIVIAEGAELVVNTSCGSTVFGAATDDGCELTLDGKLTLGDEIAATVKALYVEGILARHDKTYGSDASEAEKKDALHFGGTGTVVSSLKGGLMLIVR